MRVNTLMATDYADLKAECEERISVLGEHYYQSSYKVSEFYKLRVRVLWSVIFAVMLVDVVMEVIK